MTARNSESPPDLTHDFDMQAARATGLEPADLYLPSHTAAPIFTENLARAFRLLTEDMTEEQVLDIQRQV